MIKNRVIVILAISIQVLLNLNCSSKNQIAKSSKVEPTNDLQQVRFSVDPLRQTRSYGAFVSARSELVVYDSANLSVSNRIAESEDYEYVSALGGSDGFALVNDRSIAFAGAQNTVKLAHELESVDVIYPSPVAPEVILKDRGRFLLSHFELFEGRLSKRTISTGDSEVFVEWTGTSDETLVIAANGVGYFYGSAEQLFSRSGQWPPCALADAGFSPAEGEKITGVSRMGDGSFALGTTVGRVVILEPSNESCAGTAVDALSLGQPIVSLSAFGDRLFIRSGESALNAGKIVASQFTGDWSGEFVADAIPPVLVADGLLMLVTSGVQEVDSSTGEVVSEEPTSIILFDNEGAELNRFRLSSSEIDRIEGIVLDVEARKLILVENSSAGSVKVFDLEAGQVQIQRGGLLGGVLDRL